jgi:predicted ATP-grasp superfamily ATP-dependent carboligase
MRNSMKTILILDGHTNQALACVRSLGRAGYRVLVASHMPFQLGAWSRYCKGHLRLAGQTLESHEVLRDWARREGVDIVLPVTERSCLLCNLNRTKWEEMGVVVGCGTDDILRNAANKANTIQRAKACGLRVPPTEFPNSLEEGVAAVEKIGFPCVIKPRWSSVWDGGCFSPNSAPAYANTRKGLEKLLIQRKQEDHWPLIQGFVPGRGKGVFALCDSGSVIAWFAHERLRETKPTGSGSSLRRSVSLEPRLRQPAERLLRNLKWHGPAMVEFKDDGQAEPCLMEVNGRFWGSLQLAVDAGVDFPLLWISILQNQPLPPTDKYEEGVALRWLWGDIKRVAWIMRGVPAGYTGAFPSIRDGLRDLLGRQPPRTRLEAWRAQDPLPAIGELFGGLKEFVDWFTPLKSTQDNNGEPAADLVGGASEMARLRRETT